MRETPTLLLQNYDINRLPSLPHILIKLLNACMDDDVSFEVISDLISSDASLTAKVIATANSPIYGHASQLTSLKHTLMFLGLKTIKSIAITASVQQFFSEYDTHTGLQLAEFWQHSLLTALIAKNLAELTHYHSPDEAYMAALLHDIGKLVFQLDQNKDYQHLIEQANDSEHLLDLEQQQYQLSHDELGAYLLSEWGLSSFISDAVRYHHAPDSLICDAHLLVKILNTANKAAHYKPPQAFTCNTFDLSTHVMIDIIQSSREQMLKISRSMGIDKKNKQSFENKQIELAHHVKAIAISQPGLSQENEDLQFNINYSSQLLFNIKNTCLFIYNHKRECLDLDYPKQDISISIKSTSIINQCLLRSQITSSADININDVTIIDKQIMNLLSSQHIICLALQKSNVKYGVLVMSTNQSQITNILKNKFQLKLYSEQLTQYYIQNQQSIQKLSELEDTIESRFMMKAKEVVHEANNPLSVINNYLHILSNKFTHDQLIKDDLNVIQNEIKRVGNIILRCTEENQTQNSENEKTDINNSIQQLINIYKSSIFISNKTNCKLNLYEDLPDIKTNINHLKQILSNIIKNAVEAMHEDGAIEISTHVTNLNGKNFISISIQDSGTGIPKHVLENLYKPVQTTKDSSHSGLGLSIAKNMIENIRGSITCDTNTKGTKFTLLLPVQ